MFCPKCEKQNNKEINIKFIKDIKSFERERECECGNKFITYEHNSPDGTKLSELRFKYIKNITRKTPVRTLWQDWRFLCYAKYFFRNVFYHELIRFAKKHNLEQEVKNGIVGVENIKSNKSGIIWYQLKDSKSKKVYKHKARGIKIRTIKQVLEHKDYWEARKYFFPKKKVSDIDKEDEAKKFRNSIVHKKTGIRAKKYNIDFFRKEPELAHAIDKVQGVDKGISFFWEIWKQIH